MPKTTSKPKSKVVHKTPRRKPKPQSADNPLAEHLKQAEHHLIEAVKLFSGPRKPDRAADYYRRLMRAQEMVTWLYREELVRIRGPLSRKGKK